ncbi:glucuronate isomerase [Rathayibacter sp. VKM Ac-2835]|uniref:glucuronate isomerase n=1 Tax=Rathayibacter sp. VKM Ac-2835 TaxID=2739043 RepID=UPI001565C824|nr:glucuronate isomerase [Rathayibacter sp. VKM Ac-2835]NRG43071.1 glucuronate isomerase [Rathayibacter sp. VKM Ac-2835]
MQLSPDPDRLLPVDPRTRAIARDLYDRVAALPILSPHGHVDPRILVDDIPFDDASQLFIRYDHYVTRLMHAAGVGLDELGIPGNGTIAHPREVWRTFSRHWPLYAGTASGFWLQNILAEQFGITEHPAPHNADRIFDLITAALTTPEFRPRALFDAFGIEVMATTDDPMDDLSSHAALAADPTFRGRVLPTFRPDAYLDPAAPGWAERIARLADWNGSADSSYAGYLNALEGRRRYFLEHGAVSADHGMLQPLTVELEGPDAAALFERALSGGLGTADARIFAGHMLLQMARMSTEDGLVMTVHPGVLRNHDTATFERYGPDTGHDIPVATSYVENLRPLLQRYGNTKDFHLVLFSIDETIYSREIAPLAGYYPSVFIGAPWWFLDAPDAILRFRAATTETAGFSRGSGFIDDTRAFLSIPARHDMARRLDSAFLARLTAEGRIDLPTAERTIVDLVDTQPRKVFKL